MSKTLKSSGSSRPVALKSTSAKPTKVEKIVRYSLPEPDWLPGQRKRLAALENVPDEGIDFSDIPPLTGKQLDGMIRPHVYPPVPIDAEVVEWFMARAGGRMKLMYDLNRVLKNYVRAQKRRADKKAG